MSSYTLDLAIEYGRHRPGILSRGRGLSLDAKARELARIERKLREYMQEAEARRTAARIHALTVEVDQEINRILSDPLVPLIFKYDGKLFIGRGTSCFHRAFNGINILESLTNPTLECYFRVQNKRDAVEWLMKDLGSHVCDAKVRRRNWEYCGSLSCLSDDVIAEVIRRVNERRRLAALAAQTPSELSPEEKSFFKRYEDELECGEYNKQTYLSR